MFPDSYFVAAAGLMRNKASATDLLALLAFRKVQALMRGRDLTSYVQGPRDIQINEHP
jgi:hypothetical protein